MKITAIIAFLVSMSISSSTNAVEISAYETFDESLSGIYIGGVANGIWYLQALNQTEFTGEHKAWKVSHDQRKFRKPFFDRSACARSAFGA